MRNEAGESRVLVFRQEGATAPRAARLRTERALLLKKYLDKETGKPGRELLRLFFGDSWLPGFLVQMSYE
jgi:hypothetical protein